MSMVPNVPFSRLTSTKPAGFIRSKERYIAKDKDGQYVFMAETKAWLQMVQDNFPDIEFHFTSEF